MRRIAPTYRSCMLCQYCYDEVSEGKPYRKHVFLALGLFHIYLYTSKELVRYCARYFLMPLYHRLFPTGQFHMNMKLKESAALFTRIRIAYPLVSHRVELALGQVDLQEWQRSMLENIHVLCDYYIPLVLTFLYVSWPSRLPCLACSCLFLLIS